jgi:hypothetical protein
MIDPKVTVEALDVVLGSMYSGEVTFETGSVTAVAAACRMLQLEALLAKCGEIMMQSLGAKVIIYERVFWTIRWSHPAGWKMILCSSKF